MQYSDNYVLAHYVEVDIPNDLVVEINNRYDFGATIISSSTILYNCHSYAWLGPDDCIGYWIDDPSNFYIDGRYQEVTEPQEGDIICYFDSNGENIHSGRVTGIRTVIGSGCDPKTVPKITSKWGVGGLYEHDLEACPYYEQNDFLERAF